MKTYFDHEKLNVYREALNFVSWSEVILERIPPKASIHGQFDRARTSIPLNIAEGNGKFTAADRCRFFDIAWGSSLECASCLDVLLIKKLITEDELDVSKGMLKGIVSMLVGLIKSHDASRLKEESTSYQIRGSEYE